MAPNVDQYAKAFEKAVDRATAAGQKAMEKFLADKANEGLAKQPQIPARLALATAQARSKFIGVQPLAGVRPLSSTNPVVSRPMISGQAAGASELVQPPKVSWEREDLRMAGEEFARAFREELGRQIGG